MRRSLLCAAAAVLVLAAARPVPAADTKPLSDQEFVRTAAAAGRKEVTLGKMAEAEGTRPEVKDFGMRMVTDHTKANRELLELATAKKADISTRPDAKDAAALEKFAKLRGAEFDREYMKQMVTDHEEAVALFEREAKDGQDPELKAWAAKTLPTLREHLKMARDLAGAPTKDKDHDR
jgi:putative membrane protein